jgi:hypothetical protein
MINLNNTYHLHPKMQHSMQFFDALVLVGHHFQAKWTGRPWWQFANFKVFGYAADNAKISKICYDPQSKIRYIGNKDSLNNANESMMSYKVLIKRFTLPNYQFSILVFSQSRYIPVIIVSHVCNQNKTNKFQ